MHEKRLNRDTRLVASTIVFADSRTAKLKPCIASQRPHQFERAETACFWAFLCVFPPTHVNSDFTSECYYFLPTCRLGIHVMTSGLFRSAVSGPTVAAAALGLIGFTNSRLRRGAGRRDPSNCNPAPKPTAAIEALKADYRRPAPSFRFPKEDPYTVEKAALGKKLYFDSASSGHLRAILCELSQPRLRLGRRAVGRHRSRHGQARPAFAEHRQERMGFDLHVGRSRRRASKSRRSVQFNPPAK